MVAFDCLGAPGPTRQRYSLTSSSGCLPLRFRGGAGVTRHLARVSWTRRDRLLQFDGYAVVAFVCLAAGPTRSKYSLTSSSGCLSLPPIASEAWRRRERGERRDGAGRLGCGARQKERTELLAGEAERRQPVVYKLNVGHLCLVVEPPAGLR